MFENDTIKELLAQADIVPRDKILICLGQEPLQPHMVAEIRELAISLGLRAAKGWNISKLLSNAKEQAIRTANGWELTAAGKSRIADVAGPMLPPVTALVVSGLRNQLPTISNESTRSFVEESVKALESKLYRSAIVLSWVGAISVFYDHVLNECLSEFNAEVLRRDQKWKAAKTRDDLTRMKEYDFLQVLAALSVIGKNVKDELEVCLKLRNGCGHPNSLVVGEHKASAHVETLMQNVFAKF
ncbi:hypothetical protein LGM57_21210 [Burkholderia cepacia]|uniref:hypothetical protein n=1 Tax=Burkholderia cepacia TaxID=292 RepID=UPI001C97DFCB|nr:hypothetical protein [Burkholderia cepacia]MBY4802077.1 hypothetical protein [Burkholderia cepacia]MCA7978847.1 hypothetical protein [Burkholderia cepacia]MCA8320732.1 hypothetical protein [Burkholderia cepacia]MCA8331578.1 hypothetical protein [Burkholderia cepacia]